MLDDQTVSAYCNKLAVKYNKNNQIVPPVCVRNMKTDKGKINYEDGVKTKEKRSIFAPQTETKTRLKTIFSVFTDVVLLMSNIQRFKLRKDLEGARQVRTVIK